MQHVPPLASLRLCFSVHDLQMYKLGLTASLVARLIGFYAYLTTWACSAHAGSGMMRPSSAPRERPSPHALKAGMYSDARVSDMGSDARVSDGPLPRRTCA